MKSIPDSFYEDTGIDPCLCGWERYYQQYSDWLEDKLIESETKYFKSQDRIKELEKVLNYATLGSCHCLCKSDNPEDHSDWCLYKKIKDVLNQ